MSILFSLPDTATTEIYTLSLHDALPISITREESNFRYKAADRLNTRAELSNLVANNPDRWIREQAWKARDRKSTRLNSSHQIISYAVFCLKKKKQQQKKTMIH